MEAKDWTGVDPEQIWRGQLIMGQLLMGAVDNGAVDNGGVFSSTEISKVSSSKGAQNSKKRAPDLFKFGEGGEFAASCPLNPPLSVLGFNISVLSISRHLLQTLFL